MGYTIFTLLAYLRSAIPSLAHHRHLAERTSSSNPDGPLIPPTGLLGMFLEGRGGAELGRSGLDHRLAVPWLATTWAIVVPNVSCCSKGSK